MNTDELTYEKSRAILARCLGRQRTAEIERRIDALRDTLPPLTVDIDNTGRVRIYATRSTDRDRLLLTLQSLLFATLEAIDRVEQDAHDG